MNDLGAAAVNYARCGWYVFPLAPRGKTPITKRGMLDASCDPGLVAAWWDQPRHRPPNIGINCGKSGLLVVDLDGEEAVSAWAELAGAHGGHERTLVARTGQGYHVYFRGKGPSTAGRIGPKIDTRGAGGYVVGVPSVHGSGAVYRWIDAKLDPAPVPEWVLEALERGAVPESPVGERHRLPNGVAYTLYGRKAITAIAEEMAATVEGERNMTLNALAYRCGRLSAAGQVAGQVARHELVAAAVEAGLDADEAEATFRSGFTSGLFRPVCLERK